MAIMAMALDPGVTTGVAVGALDGSRLYLEIDQKKFTHRSLYMYLHRYFLTEVIYETFEYRNAARAGLNLTPVEMIGVIKFYGETRKANLYPQNAAEGKGYFTDDKLKSLNAYRRGTPHGRDASRHLLQWFKFKRGAEWTVGKDIQIELVPPDWILETYMR